MSAVVRCGGCRFWCEIVPNGCGPEGTDMHVPSSLFPRDANHEEQALSFRVGQCMCPRVRHGEAMVAADEAVSFDWSEYKSALYTAEQFGCVLGEPLSPAGS